MVLVLGTLTIAALLGIVAGGRLSHLSSLRIRWMPVAVLGFALQVIPAPSRTWSLALLYASFAVLGAFCVANLREGMPGFRLILVGLLLNVAVIAANGGMPVSRDALERSGQRDTLSALVSGKDVKHHLARPVDLLLPLADVIPIAPLHQIVSVGDAFTYSGVAWLVFVGTMRRRKHAPPRALKLARAEGERAGV